MCPGGLDSLRLITPKSHRGRTPATPHPKIMTCNDTPVDGHYTTEHRGITECIVWAGPLPRRTHPSHQCYLSTLNNSQIRFEAGKDILHLAVFFFSRPPTTCSRHPEHPFAPHLGHASSLVQKAFPIRCCEPFSFFRLTWF